MMKTNLMIMKMYNQESFLFKDCLLGSVINKFISIFFEKLIV